jgi:hypothetical protein
LRLRQLILWAGLVGTVPGLPIPAQRPAQNGRPQDVRLIRLQAFFEAAGSPVRHLAADFLAAADRHHLDWRLLPSISLVESGAGKHCSGNNVFGWKSGRKEFASVREAIYLVASRLAVSRIYRGKDLNGILAAYNPRKEYAARVKSVMRRVDPNEPTVVEQRPTQSAELQLPTRPE